ncbi:hypothetical protein yc1106_09599 [Curvularia clavata]|uniref:Uncharacterized protein n=1 Tax=Curvularia clavata TaxID=95742 RepID=A0A9Q8ZIH5_CURCL|nr:hypothetical protein yc1106_09599 [Curvularia clavata]
MPLDQESKPSVAGAEPPTKKVKVTNKGSEIEQMRVIAEEARKPVILSSQPPQPSASRQGVSDKASIQRHPSAGKPILPRSNIEIANAVTTKQPLAVDYVTLQRMSENAIKAIQKRRQALELAIDAILPLMKKNHAVETAVIALQQQVEDCISETRKLKQFMHAAHTGGAKSRELKTFLTLASLCTNHTKTLKAEEREAPKAKTTNSDKKRGRDEESVQIARANNKTPAGMSSHDAKATIDHPPTKKQKTSSPKEESSSATPRESTPRTHTLLNIPIARSPRVASTVEVDKNLRQVAPKVIISTAQPRSGRHPRSGMGGGMKNFLKKYRLGPYSG